jgi:hypothetical protein
MRNKRIYVCLAGGVISAVVCLGGSQVIFGFPPIDWSTISMTVANRLLLGFVIGISSWQIKRYLHGALLGLILSLTVSIGFLPGEVLKFFLYTTAGILYGVFIDWFSAAAFKAPREIASPFSTSDPSPG